MQGVKKVVLWAKQGCPFCATAEKVLKSQGITYTYIDVGSSDVSRSHLADLIGESKENLTVPKVFINGQLVKTSEELSELSRTSALAHMASGSLQTIPRQCCDGPSGSVAILHTGPTNVIWLDELKKSLDARGANVSYLDADKLGTFDMSAGGTQLPFSVLINRVSDAVPPEDNRFVTSFLAFCEGSGIPVVNGATAYAVTTSKIAQHGYFSAAGCKTPRTFMVRNAEDVACALAKFDTTGKVLFKPNAGSFGGGIVKFDTHDQDKLQGHASRKAAFGNDGIAMLQEYHAVSEVYRVFILGGQVLCGVKVAISPEQEFSAQCMASAQKRRKIDGASAVMKMEVPDDVKEDCIRSMKAAHADAGSIEYLVHPKTGERLYYDLNLLSTFPSEATVGRDCWGDLADYILSKQKGKISKEGFSKQESAEVKFTRLVSPVSPDSN